MATTPTKKQTTRRRTTKATPKVEAPAPTEAALIKRIAKMRADGQSWRVLSAALNDAGVTTLRGKTWAANGTTAFNFAGKHGIREG